MELSTYARNRIDLGLSVSFGTTTYFIMRINMLHGTHCVKATVHPQSMPSWVATRRIPTVHTNGRGRHLRNTQCPWGLGEPRERAGKGLVGVVR